MENRTTYPVAGGFHASEAAHDRRRVAFGRTPSEAEDALAQLLALDARLSERVERGEHLKPREDRRP